MNNKLQKILAEIKKESQFVQLNKPKGNLTSTPENTHTNYEGAENILGGNAPSKNTSSVVPQASVAQSIPAVKQMQTAMQELAQTVIQDSESGTMSMKSRDALQPSASEAVKKSKKSFNDFIAEQYIGSLDEGSKGVEWSKDPSIVKYPAKNQTQTDIYELDAVMNTLNRIGAERSEFKIDGNWDWRTNNALKNILGFAYALLQLEGDFGLDNTIYNSGNWQDFKNTLSGYEVSGNKVILSSEEKQKRALNISKHLRAISKLYNVFRQQVIAHPEFRPFLEGKRSFDKYDQQGTNKDNLNQYESQMAGSDAVNIDGIDYIAPGLPAKQLHYIPLKALSNKEEYLKWMLDYAGVPTENTAMMIFNNVIKPKIEAM